jgi:hypothetical protein
MGKKNILDKFYTKFEVAKKLLLNINLSKYDCVIEPSAGDGSFSRNITHSCLLSMDICPENDNIIEHDWFNYDIPNCYNSVIVVGNPPFGSRNNLSKKFITHSLSFSNVDTIAFVLPDVFNKYTNQKIFPKNWSLARVVKLEVYSFTLDGNDYNVPCSFFIWTKNDVAKDYRRYENDFIFHPDFRFVDKKEADFFVLGASPSTIRNIEDVHENNRGYYIKSNINVELVKSNFKNTPWNLISNSSVSGGVAWLTKSELIQGYAEYAPI